MFYMEDGVLFCRDDHSLVCFPNLLADPYEDGDEDDYEPVTYKVPAGTEIIRGGAFGDVECLSEILLLDSLRVIGSQAFGFCWSLDSLIIPDSVQSIGEYAFESCSKDLVVLCGPDSCAKSYCEQNGIEFLVK